MTNQLKHLVMCFIKTIGGIMKKFRIILKIFALLTVIFMFAACGAGNGPAGTASEAFNTSNLPYAVPDSSYGAGTFAFDADGNLLFTVNKADEIRLMNRETGAVSTVATGISGGSFLLGMVYNGGYIYVGDDSGYIYQIDPATGVSTLVINLPGEGPNGLAVAPSTFGSYGGQLIVATSSGHIYAVDQSLAVPTATLIVDVGATYLSYLIFGSDGTLYVADNGGGRIVTVTSGGSVADFATGLNYPDGLAIDDSAGYLYVACYGDDTLKSVTIPGGVVSTVGSYNFDSGYAPSPIIYDSASNILLLGTGETSLTINYYSF